MLVCARPVLANITLQVHVLYSAREASEPSHFTYCNEYYYEMCVITTTSNVHCVVQMHRRLLKEDHMLRAAYSNHRPQLITSYFVKSVSQAGSSLCHVCTDCGMDNVTVANIQAFVMGHMSVYTDTTALLATSASKPGGHFSAEIAASFGLKYFTSSLRLVFSIRKNPMEV